MKKLILVTAALAAFAFQAEASYPRCVPTKSESAARADYDRGLQALNLTLAAEYDAASAKLEHDYAMAQECHEQRLVVIKAEYEQELAMIKRDLNPGWRQALEDSTARHNKAVQVANDDYQSQNNLSMIIYNSTTEQSRMNYDRQAADLAAEYNRAICANP